MPKSRGWTSKQKERRSKIRKKSKTKSEKTPNRRSGKKPNKINNRKKMAPLLKVQHQKLHHLQINGPKINSSKWRLE